MKERSLSGIALFSGGKDCLYAQYLAEAQGITIPYLLVLKTTIGTSPHYENVNELEKITRAMKRELLIFDMRMGDHALAEFISSLNVDYLIAGDVFLEDHFKWITRIAKKAKIKALEPLWGKNTFELAREILTSDFEYTIIATHKEKLSKEWLGYTFSSIEDLEYFLQANPQIDPIGEFGEFHTIVLKSPFFKERLKLRKLSIKESEKYWWMKFRLVRG
ncbi:ATP pyrophosphatase [Thermococcus sp. MV5]|uniref:PAB0415 family putative ATP pyrophosphatase n=1 Tax=Thermococcus sp. MV5 TaxID=1638272 RepID=UPI001439047B|nr:ATP pyrophosphatase [Thermococcus sp. MV5]NJE26725.1 ATP pyrophosphatase [Thermococcus sp. MV5]